MQAPALRPLGSAILFTICAALYGPVSHGPWHSPQGFPQDSPGKTASASQIQRAGPAIFERIAIIGASMSGGYGLQLDLKATVTLGDILDCTLTHDREPTLNLGDLYLFRSPKSKGESQIRAAVEHNPSLVVAVDFLFWFSYGTYFGGGRSHEYFEHGLNLLDEFECPLLVGDIPDMRMALKGKGPLGVPMLNANMIPPEEKRQAMNLRLAQWAEERENVTLVPLADYRKDVLSGNPIKLRGNHWTAEELESMLQADLLHPRPHGVECILLLSLDQLCRARPGIASSVSWSAELIHKRLLEKTAPARAAYEEKARKRAERKAAREARRTGKEGDGHPRPQGRTPLAAVFLGS